MYCKKDVYFHASFYIVSTLHIDNGIVSSQRRILVRCNKTERNELLNHPGEKYEYEDKCYFAIYNSSDEGSEETGMYC